MLCPEVYNFKAPESSFHIRKSATGKIVYKTLELYFPHLVSVVIPDVLKLPDYLTESLTSSSQYFKVTDFSLTELINRNFISGFVVKGSVNLLSINTRLDCDNCVSLTPDGYLFLNLDKQSYQSLGLEGKVSHFNRKIKDRYIVSVNLRQVLTREKTYERTENSLKKLEKFTVIFKWDPPSEEICHSSIAKYFSDLNYNVSYSNLNFKQNTQYSLKVPLMNLESCSDDEVIAFAEWLGTLAVEANVDGSSENYLSTYEVSEPNSIMGQVKVLQWRGLFSAKQITRFFESLQKFTKVEQKDWVSVYVQGFSDSVIGWCRHQENHYYTNGDNGCLFILNKNICISCSSRCSQKQYK